MSLLAIAFTAGAGFAVGRRLQKLRRWFPRSDERIGRLPSGHGGALLEAPATITRRSEWPCPIHESEFENKSCAACIAIKSTRALAPPPETWGEVDFRRDLVCTRCYTAQSWRIWSHYSGCHQCGYKHFAQPT